MTSELISLEAEQAVIGSVLIAPQVYDDVASLLPDDFATEDHRKLWAAIREDESCRDFLVLGTRFPALRVYVCEMARNTPGAANAKFYAQVVKERAGLRALASACTRILSRLNGSQKAADAIGSAMREIEAVGAGAVVGSGPRHVGELAPAWYDAYLQRANSQGKIVGLSTGFQVLDERWSGMRGGQMIVIAGRPKRGKSTLAANIAQYVAREHPVCVFNLEMGANEIIDRAVASEGLIKISDITRGKSNDDHYHDSMISAWASVKSSRLYIDDTPVQTIDTLRLHAKAFQRKHGKGLFVVDYLQLISGEENPYQRVSNVSRGLKLLAKETDCPVIAIVQMNRAIDSASRKPILSDLRDSGAIEQDADIVCFCHQDKDEQEHSEIITRAIRSGAPGTDYLGRDFGRSRFVELPEGWAPMPETIKEGRRKGGFEK